MNVFVGVSEFQVSEFWVDDFLFQKQFSIIHASNILFTCSFVLCLLSFVFVLLS